MEDQTPARGVSKEHILNICKRIDEGKATEEETCYLRDLALAAVGQGGTAEGADWVMSNDELRDAIQAAWELVYKTGSTYEHYRPTQDHYKALLKEQERRALLSAAPRPDAREEKEPKEILASRLIDAWCADKGKKIPWAKAVQIVAIVTEQSDAKRDHLLKMGDEDGACEMCGRTDATEAARALGQEKK